MENKILAVIEYAKTLHTEYEYLHGGCYALAKSLSELFDGEVLVSREKEHCIARINNAYYDIRGCVKSDATYHPFRPKEEKRISKEYFLVSPSYTQPLINKIIACFDAS